MALLTPAEAAREMAISVKHLRMLPLPFINVGNATRVVRRYDPVDIREFLEARRCQSTSDEAHIPIHSTSSSEVTDIRDVRAKLLSQKRPRSKKPKSNG